MSYYREVKTEFINGESLKKALQDLGIEFTASANLRENRLSLVTNYRGYMDSRDLDVAIAVQREQARRAGIGSWDGLGFRWNGKSYDQIQDHLDETHANIQAKMNLLRQRYAYHEVSRQARSKGYTVNEHKSTDGTIRLTLVRR